VSRLGALEVFKLETAAKQDREDLRSNLELLREGHVCDASCARSQAVGLLDTKVLGAQSSREAGFPRNLQRTQIHQRSSPRRY
jgi:hypothetical protein